MRELKKFARGAVWTVAICLCATPLMGQQQGGEKPKPAARQYSPALDTSDNQEDTAQDRQTVQPDDRPLSGVQNPTLGTPEMRHSYWVPGIQYGNTARSRSTNPAANAEWNTTSFLSGDMSLREAWSHSTLSANYSGGGFSSTDPQQGNGQYHQLAAAFEIDQRRWQALFVNQFSYLPQSAFGFGGTSGLSTPGITGSLAVPLPGLQSAYVPSQTILSVGGPRYSNSSAAQLTYKISKRGSFTVAGVYGILRFVDSGNVNSDTEMFNAGYDYAITRKNSIGFTYRFSAYRYPGDPQALGDHVAQFEYGRKMTGRLTLKLGGGPEVTIFRVPINGSTQRISGSGNGSLIYAFSRSNLTLSYAHGVSSGSGVFTGSDTDQVNTTWNRQLTRVWSGDINFGYANNRQILTVSGITSPSYDSWFAGAGLSRSLGRTANFALAYQAQIQNANVAVCGVPNCGTNYVVHQVFLSFQWHARPLVLR